MTEAVQRRPEWLLLRMHYLRVLGPLAAVFAGTYVFFFVMFLLVSRFSSYGELAQGGELLDYIWIVLCALVALPVGAGVFSRPFKEQHVLFFHALPIPRLRQWAILAAASALALLTALAAVAVLRPSSFATLAKADGGLAVFGAVIVIAFAAGLCFSLVFARTVAVYVVAYIAAVALPLLALGALIAPMVAMIGPQDRVNARQILEALFSTEALPIGVATLVMVLALLVATLTVASAVFYVRGETTLPRVQLRNLAIVLGASLLVALVIGPMLHALGPAGALERLYPEWISPDTRFCLTRYVHTKRQTEGVLRVFDLTRGEESATIELSGMGPAAWTPHSMLAVVARDISPFRRLGYLLAANDRLHLYAPDGKLLESEELHGEVQDLGIVQDRLSIALRRDGVMHVLVRDAKGPARTIFSAPAEGPVQIWEDVLFLLSESAPTRAWKLRADGATEIPRVAGAVERESPVVFGGELYAHEDLLQRTIASTWPVPQAPGDRVTCEVRERGRVQPWIYATVEHPGRGTATIYVLGDTKRWTLVAESPLPLVKAFWTGVGVAMYQERTPNGFAYRVHDATSGARATVLETNADDPRLVSASMNWLSQPRGHMIYIHAGKRGEYARTVAEVLLRDGRFQHLAPGNGQLIALWPDGRQVRKLGASIIVVDAKGGRTVKVPQ